MGRRGERVSSLPPPHLSADLFNFIQSASSTTSSFLVLATSPPHSLVVVSPDPCGQGQSHRQSTWRRGRRELSQEMRAAKEMLLPAPAKRGKTFDG